MNTNESEDMAAFWAEKEKEAGAPVVFRSFARLIGEPGEGVLDISGLMYATEHKVFFEDFDKTTFVDLLLKSKKKYEKYAMTFYIRETVSIKKVAESSALSCVEGKAEGGSVVSKLKALLSTPVWEISLNNGRTYFFELFETEKLKELISRK